MCIGLFSYETYLEKEINQKQFKSFEISTWLISLHATNGEFGEYSLYMLNITTMYETSNNCIS